MITLAGFAAARDQPAEVKLSADNTKIEFQCSKMTNPVVTHVGGFKKFTGTASYQGNDLTTLKIKVDIDLNTLFTDEPKVTSHLKTPDFFDTKTYPTAKFESTKVEKDGADYKLTGKLTMHGKTKEVTFPAKLEAKDGGLNLTSKFKINRHDWAISYGKGFVIDDVSMDVTVNAKK